MFLIWFLCRCEVLKFASSDQMVDEEEEMAWLVGAITLMFLISVIRTLEHLTTIEAERS